MNKILVIGGTNIDYVAKCTNDLIYKDSNIGNINYSFGGVGFNIASNLALLKNDVSFISSVGSDEISLKIKDELIKRKIKLFVPKSNYGTGIYFAINDKDGEMQLAVCDLSFFDNLKYEALEECIDLFNSHSDIVLDTNLNQNLLEDIVKNNKNKNFYIDAVSANKVSRIKNILPNLFVFKSNYIEAQKLIGDDLSQEEIIRKLLEIGVKIVIITNSEKDIYYGDESGIYKTEPLFISKKDILNVNGAGDAFFSTFISSYIDNSDIKNSIEKAKKASYYTLKSSSSICDNLFEFINQK